MTTIASLRILLGLDSGGVKTGASKVNDDLKGVQRQANATNDTLRNIGKGIGAGLGLGAGFAAFTVASKSVRELTDFLGESVQAAIEEEAGIKRLGQSLLANIPAFDGNTAAIEANIAAKEQFGFADDELRSSLAALAGATHDVETSFELQSLAMDLARFKGEDLASATAELIKVQAGSFRSLKALGIELEATATSSEAFAAIQKVVAGQTEAFGNTTAGAMTAAGIAVNNLQEDIGTLLAPAVRDIANAIREDIIPAFRELGDVIGALKPAFDLLHDVAANLLQPLARTLDVIRELQKATSDHKEVVNAEAVAFGELNAAQTALQSAFADGKLTEDQYRKASEDLDASFQALIVATDGFNHVAQETREHTLAAGAALDRAHDSTERLAAAEKALVAESSNVSEAQLRVAQATVDAGAAHTELAAAQKAAAEAARGDTAAIVALAEAQVTDARATAELKAAQDALAGSAVAVKAAMLGARRGTDDTVAALLQAAKAAAILKGDLDALPRTVDIEVNFGFERIGGDIVQRTLSDADSYLEGLRIAGEAKATADALAAAAAAAADAKAAAALAEFRRLQAEAAANAKRNASEMAAAYRERLGDAFDAVKRKAREFFDDLHQRNLDAIRDIHDRANAELAEQQKVIRGAVDAERARVEAIRTRRQEQTLRTNVAVATDPEDLARAQQALNDFLDDQRIKFLGSQADTQIAALEAQKAANDKLAAEAIAAENERNQAQVAAFDFELAALQKKLSEHPKAWASSQQDILKLLMAFGVDYKKAGESLGKQFAAGLLLATRAAEDAAKALADAVAKPLGVVAPPPVPPVVPPIPPPVPLIDVEAIRQATEMLDAQTLVLTSIGPAAVAGFSVASDALVAFGASATVAAAETASATASIRDAIASITAAALTPIRLTFDEDQLRVAQESFEAQRQATRISAEPIRAEPPMAPAPSVNVAAGLAPREIVIHTHLHLGPEEIAEVIERVQFNLEGIYQPTPVSTGSQR